MKSIRLLSSQIGFLRGVSRIAPEVKELLYPVVTHMCTQRNEIATKEINQIVSDLAQSQYEVGTLETHKVRKIVGDLNYLLKHAK